MRAVWNMALWEEELSTKLIGAVGYPFGRLWDRHGLRDPVFLQVIKYNLLYELAVVQYVFVD